MQDKHNEELMKHRKQLAALDLQYLEYKASNGTDFKVELMKNVLWGGGVEFTDKGLSYNPNIPSEYMSMYVRLMMHGIDVRKYVNDFKTLQPEYITFHYEAIEDVEDMIKYIKSLNIKVGLSIKPNTEVSLIKPYLKDLDLVLIMSVEPGEGGQKFINSSTQKIDELYTIRKDNNYHYAIEVDGGINDVTIKECVNADILVVGSFITNGNYQEQIDKIRG